VPADLNLIGPGEESRCWSARFRSPSRGFAAHGDQAIEYARDPLAGMRDNGNGSRAFPRAVVDNGGNAEATPAGELIGDKVSDQRSFAIGGPANSRPSAASSKIAMPPNLPFQLWNTLLIWEML